MENKIDKNLFAQCDPVAKFITGKLGLTPIIFAFIWTLIVIFIGFTTAAISNTLVSTPSKVGILQDWVWQVWTLLVTPCLTGYYLWSSTSIGEIIQKLQMSEVIIIQENEIDEIIAKHKKPWRLVLSIALMIFTGIVYFISREEFTGFASSSTITRIGVTFTFSILAFFSGMLVLTLILNIYSIRHIMKEKELNVNPLHPDKSGGLKTLSDYSLKIIYLIAVFGIVLGISGYRLIDSGYSWAAFFLVVFYIGVAIISFFSPLSTAHEEMKKAKEKLLLTLGKQFWDEYMLTQSLIQDNVETLKDEVEKMKQLRELYKLTNEFPVWPFDMTTLRRFGITVATPIIPLLFNLVRELFVNVFNF